MNTLLLTDFYKPHHNSMYPEGMTKLYSNLTPRKSRISGVNEVVVFGIQNFLLEYLIKHFNENFFYSVPTGAEGCPRDYNKENCKKAVISEYKRHIPIDTKHIEDLWDLGYLPIEIKALDEGTLCPIGVPMLTITNTHPDFAWLVNYLETLISCMLWQPITSATIAYQYKKLLTKYCLETDEKNIDFVQWQAHDFSMRGMSSVESAILSGMGHLTSFTGTDTIPAIYQLESSYSAQGLIGASVPATEHSVMCMGTKEDEIETFKRLLDLYPNGILSVVSDTWDLWKVCTKYLPALKKEILARDGKLVIRPDSGDPVDIICGRNVIKPEEVQKFFNSDMYYKTSKLNLVEKDGKLFDFYITEYQGGGFEAFYTDKEWSKNEQKGVIELLWDIFGGNVNEQGFKVLDPHIGAIYGDSITLERAEEICERLKAKGFASTNIVFGVGSYTYQYNTRDIFGFAMKATYGEITWPKDLVECDQCDCEMFCERKYVEAREIFKDPITDDGTKRSKKGLLCVIGNETGFSKDITVVDQCTWEQESQGLLTSVFIDSKLVKKITLDEIRNKLK